MRPPWPPNISQVRSDLGFEIYVLPWLFGLFMSLFVNCQKKIKTKCSGQQNAWGKLMYAYYIRVYLATGNRALYSLVEWTGERAFGRRKFD